MPVKADPRNRTAAGNVVALSVVKQALHVRPSGPGCRRVISQELTTIPTTKYLPRFTNYPLSRVTGIYRPGSRPIFLFPFLLSLIFLLSSYLCYITADERTLLRNRERRNRSRYGIALHSMCMSDRCSIGVFRWNLQRRRQAIL